LIYLVDRYGERSIYDVDFIPIEQRAPITNEPGIRVLDHLTHNVMRGNMAVWAGFYEKLFNFREIRLLRHRRQGDRPLIQGDDKSVREDPHSDQRIAGRQSQIEEYLREYKGEGIQHLALSTGRYL